ncbi:MAG: glucose-6-phosphate isomerase [Planctomycetia bacterium]|nr:glucose-6-phosphate isomerase [Planctomycetia bacterium]
MSVVRPRPPEDPIHYDPAAVLATGGVTRTSLERLALPLDRARRESLADLDRWRAGGAAAGEPLDPAFIDLPDRLLADYGTRRPESELFAILTAARRLREAVDRIVVLGIGGSYMGTRALFEACCHPFHNELSRGERGGRPRLSFEGFNIDNDSAQGLLDLLASPGGGPVGDDLLNRWALVVVSKSGGTLETAAATRLFLKALFEAVGGDRRRLAELVVPVTGRTGRLADLARAIGCPDVFDIPDGVGGRFSVFTAVGLLPAAAVGIDVVRLLEGAAAMNRRFRESPVAENPVLQYVGVSHLAEVEMQATIRVLSSWSNRLEAIGLWYDQLLSESLGKAERGATPLTTVTTRDLHSRGQQHQEGRRDKLITNLLVGEPRRDRLALPKLSGIAGDEDRLDDLVGRTWPDILAAAAAGTNEAYARDRRPTADILLPRIDEHTVGQLLQMLMLATVVEGRLVGTNPYGQPGVEAYKKLMMARLRPQS